MEPVKDTEKTAGGELRFVAAVGSRGVKPLISFFSFSVALVGGFEPPPHEGSKQTPT
jgi:hypothetical protein